MKHIIQCSFILCLLMLAISISAKPKKWKVEKSRTISFANGNQYVAEMVSRNVDEFLKEYKLSVYTSKKAKKGTLIWESPPSEGEFFEDVHVLSHHNSAVIAGVFNLGGAHALFNYVVITLSSNGMIDQIMNLNQYGFVELHDQQMIINDVTQKYVFHIADNEIIQSFYTRDQMNPADAIPALFSISGDKILARNPVMNCTVGQTIAFKPANERTKIPFNSGEISIFTDAWSYDLWQTQDSDWAESAMSEATTLHTGNFYTFDKPGTFHFLLCSTCDNITDPTITIHVK